MEGGAQEASTVRFIRLKLHVQPKISTNYLLVVSGRTLETVVIVKRTRYDFRWAVYTLMKPFPSCDGNRSFIIFLRPNLTRLDGTAVAEMIDVA